MTTGVHIRLVRSNMVGVPIRLHHSVVVERSGCGAWLFDVIPKDAEDPWTLTAMLVGEAVPAVVRDKRLTRSGKDFEDVRVAELHADFDEVVERALHFQTEYFDETQPSIQLYRSNCIHFSHSLYSSLLDFFLSSV
jgi:hypothetical protein